MPNKIQLTGGDPSTPEEAAERILRILGCNTDAGGVFVDDLNTVSTIIKDLIEPNDSAKRAEQILNAYVGGEISLARLRQCIILWSIDEEFKLPGE
jgi:chemotaxis signal transduction protein